MVKPGARPGYHPEARAELFAALVHFDRIDRENVIRDLADRFWAAVRGAEWKLMQAPHRWTPYLWGTRRIYLPTRWRYSLIYLPDHQGSPVVLALAHDRRERGYWQDRLPPAS